MYTLTKVKSLFKVCLEHYIILQSLPLLQIHSLH